MNIRKHISRRRHSERDMLLRHKRLLTLEISRKVSLHDMTTRNIDKEMGKIQKELIEMRNPSRSWQQKKQYKFPVSSPVWKRRRLLRSARGKNPRRELLLLKSFGDNDDSDSDGDGHYTAAPDLRLSTSETLLLFNKGGQDETEKNMFLNRTNLQPIISEESAIGPKTNNDSFANLNCVTSRLDNKTGDQTPSKQASNLTGLPTDPSWQPNATGKPLVVFSPEKISSFVGHSMQGNASVATRNVNKTVNNNLQPVTERGTFLLPLPPIRHDGAAATTTMTAVVVAGEAEKVKFELPEHSLYLARTLRLRSTADGPVSRPAATAQESRLPQQSSSHLPPKLMVGTGKDTRETTHRNNSTQADPGDNNENKYTNNQQGSLSTVAPDFATLARTSMSSIKKDIARRLSTTGVPAELKKLQNQRNSMNIPANKLKRHSIYSDSPLGESTLPSSEVDQLLLTKKYEGNDRRRASEEEGEHSGATASFRRLSLNTFRDPPQRQEVPVAVVSLKSPEPDSGELKTINKPRVEEKPRRKSYLKSLPTYDRELYNPDGSLRTVYCLPSFEECWEQAQQARYIRTRETLNRDKELSVDEIFAKHADSDEAVKESPTDK